MASIKILRLQKELRKMFNTVVIYNLRDERLRSVYFSDVEVSADLRQAKIYFYDNTSDLSQDELIVCLTKASGQFKKNIADAKIMRIIPELRFYYDKSQDNLNRIESIFNKITREENESEED